MDILDGTVIRVRTEGEDAILPAKDYYDGGGRYLIPGFIDAHMHVESTMMIPENLSRAIHLGAPPRSAPIPQIGNVMGMGREVHAGKYQEV